MTIILLLSVNLARDISKYFTLNYVQKKLDLLNKPQGVMTFAILNIDYRETRRFFN